MAKYYLMRKTDSVSELADVAVSAPSIGQVLKWDGTNWINDTDATGGGGGEVAPVTITTNTTAATDKHTYLVNASGGAVTLTLPTAVGRAGKVYVVKKIDSSANTVTIDGATTETIDGALTLDTALQWDVIAIESDGANWQTITPPTGTSGGVLPAPITVYRWNDHTSVTLTNMSASLTVFYTGGNTFEMPTDLTNATQARIFVRVITVGHTTAELRAQFATTFGGSYGYLDAAAGPAANISATGGALSAWVTLDASVKADGFIRVISINGNGIADPVLAEIAVQVR